MPDATQTPALPQAKAAHLRPGEGCPDGAPALSPAPLRGPGVGGGVSVAVLRWEQSVGEARPSTHSQGYEILIAVGTLRSVC